MGHSLFSVLLLWAIEILFICIKYHADPFPGVAFLVSLAIPLILCIIRTFLRYALYLDQEDGRRRFAEFLKVLYPEPVVDYF